MKLTNLPKEGEQILLFTLLAIFAVTIITSCSTTSLMGCDNLLGPERDACVEETRVRDAQYRVMEIGAGR